MKLLFKSSQSGDFPVTVGHTNFREHYASVNANMSWKSLEPTVRKATEEYLIPVISKELYDDLADKYDDGTVLSANQTEFLALCQDAVAYYTILMAAPELNIGVSDMGMVEKGSSQAPVFPASQWRYKEFKYELTKKADKAIDLLIEKLDSYVIAADAYFDLWKDSTAYADNRTSFFSTARQFDEYVRINRSRRLFNQLNIDILRAEEEIDKVICEDQFNDLVDKIKEGTAAGLELELIDKIRRYVSAKSITTCMPRLFLTLDSRGLTLSSYTDGMDSQSHHGSSARGAEAVGGYMVQLRSDADLYFKDLVAFFYDHIDDFPLIKNSACYEDYTAVGKIPICAGPGGVMF